MSRSSKGKVVATARSFCRYEGLHKRLITDAGYELLLHARPTPMGPDELSELAADADALILGLDICDASVFARAPRLKVVARQGVGVDAVDLAAAARHGVVVTNTPGANTIGVAELVFGLILSLSRRLTEANAEVKSGGWPHLMGWELHGRTLGLIGLGQIGRAVASRAIAFGMNVQAYDPFISEHAAIRLVTLDALLETSNIISLHAPLTAANHHLLDSRAFDKMLPGTVVINTARGGLIDESALARALEDGRLAGAACDAFENEPPAGAPFLSLPNFIATPHLGAATLESALRMAEAASRNALKVLAGEEGANVVALRTGGS